MSCNGAELPDREDAQAAPVARAGALARDLGGELEAAYGRHGVAADPEALRFFGLWLGRRLVLEAAGEPRAGLQRAVTDLAPGLAAPGAPAEPALRRFLAQAVAYSAIAGEAPTLDLLAEPGRRWALIAALDARARGGAGDGLLACELAAVAAERLGAYAEPARPGAR